MVFISEPSIIVMFHKAILSAWAYKTHSCQIYLYKPAKYPRLVYMKQKTSKHQTPLIYVVMI